MYHIFAFLILISFYHWGIKYKYGKENSHYWTSCLFPILIYSLAYGLRDGWGVDYDHYKDIFQHLRDTDIGLYIINYFVHSLGCGSPVAFTIYSLILAIGFFFIIKGYKNEAMYILPLLWVTTTDACGLIRFWIACGWLLMAIRCYLDKQTIKAILLFVFAACTHTSVVVFVPIILICNAVDLFPKRRIVLIVFVVATIVLDRTFLGEKLIMPMADFLSSHISNERLTMYNDDAEFWLSGNRETIISANPLFEMIHRIRNAITHFIILYLGFSIKDKYKNGVFFYNMMAISFIFFNAVQGFELVDRYIAFLRVFLAFVLSFVIYQQKQDPIIRSNFVFWLLIIFCYINLFFRPLLGSETLLYYTTYIWD